MIDKVIGIAARIGMGASVIGFILLLIETFAPSLWRALWE
jgi:hypothetical protein